MPTQLAVDFQSTRLLYDNYALRCSVRSCLEVTKSPIYLPTLRKNFGGIRFWQTPSGVDIALSVLLSHQS